MVVYWFIALPAGLTLAFKANWGLHGLWAGMVCSWKTLLTKLLALGLCALILGVAVLRSNWKAIVEKALRRDEVV